MIAKKRPFGVSILAVSNVLLAALLLAGGVQVFRSIFRDWRGRPQMGNLIGSPIVNETAASTKAASAN